MEKTKLSVVKQTEIPGEISDRLSEARAKFDFMIFAINELWGGDSTHGESTIFGCHLLMRSIEDDFAAIHKVLDPEARPGLK